MSEDFVELPVLVEVSQQPKGKIRSVNVISGDDLPTELDTQE